MCTIFMSCVYVICEALQSVASRYRGIDRCGDLGLRVSAVALASTLWSVPCKRARSARR